MAGAEARAREPWLGETVARPVRALHAERAARFRSGAGGTATRRPGIDLLTVAETDTPPPGIGSAECCGKGWCSMGVERLERETRRTGGGAEATIAAAAPFLDGVRRG